MDFLRSQIFGNLNKEVEVANAAMQRSGDTRGGDIADRGSIAAERLRRFQRAEQAYRNAEQDFIDSNNSDAHTLLVKTMSQMEEQSATLGQKFGGVRERTTAGHLCVEGGRSVPTGGASEWVDRYVVLSGSTLNVFGDKTSPVPIRGLMLDQSSHVSRTVLQPFAFQVVAPKRRGFTRSTVSDAVAHLEAGSEEERDEWVEAIEKAIAEAQPRDVSAIEQAALRLKEKMVKIVFEGSGEGEKVKLGFKLAPRQQWALVIGVQEGDTRGIQPGSIVDSINGQSAMFRTYDQCVDLLNAARESSPVELQFRCALQKQGKLRKAPMHKGMFGGWKDRHFVLGEGRLAWFTKEGGQSKGEILLEHCTVEELTGDKPHSFKIKTGAGEELVLQAASAAEMVEWGSVVLRASWVASGGQQVLDNEVRNLTTRSLDCHVKAFEAKSASTAAEVKAADDDLALHLRFLKERAASIRQHEAQLAARKPTS
jgi:hypothetical protein